MTIGVLRLTTAQIIDKAIRRCSIPPSAITNETIETAKESLFMLLSSLVTDGLNLWCIDTQYITLEPGQATYTLPSGTEDVLEVLLSRPTEVATGTINWVAPTFLVTPPGDQVELLGSEDGFATSTVLTAIAGPVTLGSRRWYRLDPSVTATEFQVTGADSVVFASSVRDLVMTPLSRNTYASLSDKDNTTAVPTNYWYEKLVSPRLTVWPVPSDSSVFMTLIRHRLISDVGTMTEGIEVPSRWYEPIVWHLALRLAFEVPGVSSERLAEIKAMAKEMTFKVEGGETDSAPVYFAPNIGVYTR